MFPQKYGHCSKYIPISYMNSQLRALILSTNIIRAGRERGASERYTHFFIIISIFSKAQ